MNVNFNSGHARALFFQGSRYRAARLLSTFLSGQSLGTGPLAWEPKASISLGQTKAAQRGCDPGMLRGRKT